MLLGPLLHYRTKLVQFVARHGREQVVNQLRVHTSPQPTFDGISHVGFARASELLVNKLTIFEHDFFALVRGRD